ncbi:MAG TPA: non-heme iron oxygenase ferredoxin subunit [Opitutus sp.]|nr:non-heme iron oxygenase ferredoxin subunit [Opitutus sp.]
MPQRVAIAKLADVPPGTGKAFAVGDRRIAVFNAGGRIFAIDDACPHDGAPLAEGTVEGTTLTCPWHGAEFDLTCGKVLCLPATEDVRSYPVFVTGDSIEVEM